MPLFYVGVWHVTKYSCLPCPKHEDVIMFSIIRYYFHAASCQSCVISIFQFLCLLFALMHYLEHVIVFVIIYLSFRGFLESSGQSLYKSSYLRECSLKEGRMPFHR